MASKKNPPKFAIANGLVIGSFPQEIQFYNKEGQRVKRKVKDDELTDTLKAMVVSLRPYGCVFAYSGVVCVSWSPVKGVQVVKHAIPITNSCPR
jgi:hypothetical protein